MRSKKVLAIVAVAMFALASTAQAADLYWDTNGTASGFGSGGTWGTDAFWTEDGTGGFSGGGTVNTTSSDVVYINPGNVSSSMGVSGSVQASRIVANNNLTTINGTGTIRLYSSGTTDADALISGAGDRKLTVYPNLVVEADSGSAVYLNKGGGNNGKLNFYGPITSTNSVDLRVNLITTSSIHDSLNHFGTFSNDSGSNIKGRGLTINGAIGSNVTDVTMSAGNFMALNNANNAYTGDTFVNSGVLRMNALDALPDTTEVWFTGGTMALNFTGEDTVAGLYFDGIPQASGTWGRLGHATADHTSAFFGSNVNANGLLFVPASTDVIPEPSTFAIWALGLLGLGWYARRRRR